MLEEILDGDYSSSCKFSFATLRRWPLGTVPCISRQRWIPILRFAIRLKNHSMAMTDKLDGRCTSIFCASHSRVVNIVLIVKVCFPESLGPDNHRSIRYHGSFRRYRAVRSDSRRSSGSLGTEVRFHRMVSARARSFRERQEADIIIRHILH